MASHPSRPSLGESFAKARRIGAVETMQVVSRRLKQAARPGIDKIATSVARGSARLHRPGSYAQALYFAVLDGHTLNLQAIVPPIEGSVAELVVLLRHNQFRVPTAIRTLPDGQTVAEATVLLGECGELMPLTPGVWRLAIEITSAAGVKRLPLRRSVKAGAMKHKGLDYPCPKWGTFFKAGLTPSGLCQITVRPPRPRAEVVHVDLKPSRLDLDIRLTGIAYAGPVEVEFGLRHSDRRHRMAADCAGNRLSVSAPIAGMAPTTGTEEIWNVWVHIPGQSRLRVGRYLHDIRHPARIFRAPERLISPKRSLSVQIRPYYTAAGSLALALSTPEAL
jgi:hypothetical protein